MKFYNSRICQAGKAYYPYCITAVRHPYGIGVEYTVFEALFSLKKRGERLPSLFSCLLFGLYAEARADFAHKNLGRRGQRAFFVVDQVKAALGVGAFQLKL